MRFSKRSYDGKTKAKNRRFLESEKANEIPTLKEPRTNENTKEKMNSIKNKRNLKTVKGIVLLMMQLIRKKIRRRNAIIILNEIEKEPTANDKKRSGPVTITFATRTQNKKMYIHSNMVVGSDFLFQKAIYLP